LDHVPPVYGKTSVNAHFSKFTGEIFVLYNGSKKSKNYNLRGEDNQIYSADPVNGFTPPWITINFRSQYQINKYLGVQLAAENIADKFYRVFASGLSAPGRNIMLTLRTKF
jgi:hemoglobin/transferrin/lactoferrin receptor protein